MKKTILTLTLAFLCSCIAQAQFTFDGLEYSMKWETSQGDASMREYLSGIETTKNWTTMLTLQSHPSAKKIAEVVQPYLDARINIIALKPKVHPNQEGDLTDIILELFLGGPGLTPHIEFVLARFIETDKGVFVIVYSNKIPLKSKKKNQEININHIVEAKDAWIKELQSISEDSIIQEF